MATDLYTVDNVRERAERIVREEVLCCVSSLVHSIAAGDGAAQALGLDDEDVFDLCARDDWEGPAREHAAGLDEPDAAEALEYALIGKEAPEGMPEDPRAALLWLMDAGSFDFQDLCDYWRLDPDRIEAYEHWIVTGWLASRLEAAGEIVARDFLGLTIWGRCTTGQSIAMDGVMLRLAAELEA